MKRDRGEQAKTFVQWLSARNCLWSPNCDLKGQILPEILAGPRVRIRLMNVKKTKMLREMVVPGVINSPQAPPTLRVRDLKNALGLNG